MPEDTKCPAAEALLPADVAAVQHGSGRGCPSDGPPEVGNQHHETGVIEERPCDDRPRSFGGGVFFGTFPLFIVAFSDLEPGGKFLAQIFGKWVIDYWPELEVLSNRDYAVETREEIGGAGSTASDENREVLATHSAHSEKIIDEIFSSFDYERLRRLVKRLQRLAKAMEWVKTKEVWVTEDVLFDKTKLSDKALMIWMWHFLVGDGKADRAPSEDEFRAALRMVRPNYAANMYAGYLNELKWAGVRPAPS